MAEHTHVLTLTDTQVQMLAASFCIGLASLGQDVTGTLEGMRIFRSLVMSNPTSVDDLIKIIDTVAELAIEGL